MGGRYLRYGKITPGQVDEAISGECSIVKSRLSGYTGQVSVYGAGFGRVAQSSRVTAFGVENLTIVGTDARASSI
jgi:hypothetical protein